jgi:molybdopterin/thiamine biosynthesis adenylyltransferase
VTPEQATRYSRHTLLPPLGEAGQERLLAARVLVVGLGGLGSPVAMYLAASGVGHLVLTDYDQVDLSNLQRQVIHRTADIGRLKVDSAQDHLQALNPTVRVTTLGRSLDEDELAKEVAAADAVVDCSDNFETRFTLNRLCVAARTPLVSGAAMRFEGQVAVFRNDGQGPCYQCLYHDDSERGDTCARIGVLAPLVGIIGSLQATETLKVLADFGETLDGRLLLLDALHMEWRTLRLRKDPTCPVCGEGNGP